MRPLRLRVEGITRFREAQQIDFEGNELELFAIVGETGSGKTSLLDAMTLALYGEVARVDGTQVSVREMVSQGLPSMQVMLDFQVGRDRFRVTRRIPALTSRSGPKVKLERLVDGIAEQYGPGSDRSKETNAIIQRMVGLDFDGFTRSVLLPQGRFAEFLTGEAKKRRDLLNDLLDLHLFERMKKRAGELEGKARAEADAAERLLEDAFGHATPAALRAARAQAKEAAGRERALTSARDQVEALAQRWAATERAAADLRTCAREAADLAARAGEAGREAASLAARAEGVEERLAGLRSALEARGSDSAGATAEREKAERSGGSLADLSAARERATRLVEERADAAEERATLERAREAIPSLVADADARDAEARSAEVELAESEAQLEEADAALEDAQHADAVAAVAAGLSPGDPCPVCGSPLEAIPEAPGAEAIERARAQRAEARRAVGSTRKAAEAAARAATKARTAADRVAKDVEVETARLGKREQRLAAMEADLATRCFPDGMPADPVADLDARIERLTALAVAEDRARQALDDARQAAADAERDRTELRELLAELAGRLVLDPSPIVARATLAAGEDVSAPSLPSPGADATDAGALLARATAVTAALGALADRLRALADDRAAAEPEMLAEAAAAVGNLVPPAERLADLRMAVEDELAKARDAKTVAEQTAKELDSDVRKRRSMEAEVKTQRGRVALMSVLARELRADRIVAYLQGEALKLLCHAGSRHLLELSHGRYRLEHAGDEFHVVDGENGDERRHVRTLSGGETFLASLSLALALAEQVTSLAVTEKAQLESLFLDEGFGTLDPDTLENVAAAIEHLGGDGRMVGVVTHVRALAERLPVRIEIKRTARGSLLTVAH
jgi:DNA repair protein SbcC/Rad50